MSLKCTCGIWVSETATGINLRCISKVWNILCIPQIRSLFLYVALYTLVFVCVSMCMSVSMLIWVWSEPAVMVVRGSSVFILYVCLKTCLTVLFLISTYMGMDW